jgi:hypothetical protein
MLRALPGFRPVATLLAVVACLVSTAVAEEPGFKALFDGSSLAGWQGDTGGYEVKEGELRCKQGAGGKLLTKDEFADFDLKFEFRLTPGANNGLGIRAPEAGDAAFVGMELQILDDGHEKYSGIAPYQAHGSIYGVVAAKRGALKPTGEWNQQEVIAKGSKIKVILNGTTIVDADIAEFRGGKKTLDGQAHPGLDRTTGRIGFLGHGDEVHFREIRVKPL